MALRQTTLLISISLAILIICGVGLAVYANWAKITGAATGEEVPEPEEFKITWGDEGGGTCNCSTCGDCVDALNNANCTTVKLTADLLDNAATCIDDPINISNKVFNCQGYSITGAPPSNSYGIYLSAKSGVVVKYCIFSYWKYGIYLLNSHYNRFTSTNATHNGNRGVYLSSSSNNNFSSGNFSLNTAYDIDISPGNDTDCNNNFTSDVGFNNNTIAYYNYSVNLQNAVLDGLILCNADSSYFQNITALNGGVLVINTENTDIIKLNSSVVDNIGISFFNSNNNNLTDGALNSNGYGAYLQNSSNILIYNNTANSNTYGIYLINSTNNNISGNTANSNSIKGIFLKYSSNNTLWNNTANLNTQDGINLESSLYNNITNNTISFNTLYGIFLYLKTNYTNVTGNTAFNNSRIGIYLYRSSNNTLFNNTANSNLWYGFHIHDTSDWNNITSNMLTSNSQYGIYVAANSRYNNLTGNTISSNLGEGLLVENSYDNIIFNNTLSSNTLTGLNLTASNTTIYNNSIESNAVGIYSALSNSTLNKNYLCNNTNWDLNASGWMSSLGDENTCANSSSTAKADGWNDTGIVGCTYACSYLAEGASCGHNSQCASGHCVHGFCSSGATYCGDGYCEGGESCSSCSIDCACSSASTGGSTPAASSGGGGGGGYAPNSVAIVSVTQEKSIVNEQGVAQTFEVNAANIPITNIIIQTPAERKNAELIIEGAETRPDCKGMPESAYSYLNIKVRDFSEKDITNAKIGFRIDKTWADEKNIAPSCIALYHCCDKKTNRLETKFVSSDEKYYYYESVTDKFSYFAIAEDPTCKSTCPHPTRWSACENNKRTRLSYNYNGTAGTCQSYEESKNCVAFTCPTLLGICIYYFLLLILILISVIFVIRRTLKRTYEKL